MVGAMRLLHTSDWHLGRTFHGAPLLGDQAVLVEQVVTLAADAQVDLVVIAGDLFDRAVPPAEAVDLFGEALARLRATGAAVVAVSGNHDSAVRVSANDRVLTPNQVTVRGDVRRATEPLLLAPDDGGAPVAVYPIPYLDPPVAGPLLGAERPAGHRLRHHDVTCLATAAVTADLAARGGGLRSVVVAHTFVDGGRTCQSERQLTVGDVERVGLAAFDGFGYVALGHLHGSQAWDGERVAYSGSPLPYSFSEEGHAKSVRLVELGPASELSVEEVPLGVGRPVGTVVGTLEHLLGDPQLADAERSWVRAVLTDRHLPVQAMARLRQRFPHAVELRHAPAGAPAVHDHPLDPTARDAATPLDLVGRFWADQTGEAADRDELALLAGALQAVAVEGAA
jgi:DNA repair protein SbcD/Mre11